ncbi:class I SAM-dependent methyltransferase, partial [Methanothermococcus sp. SCGC AD-155-K20]|nr:class I SAM-dependent methyltransferase [Methanothermococcus sp. SCGC AD-155-K20]
MKGISLYVQSANKGDSIKSKIYGDKNNIETIIKEGNGKFNVNLKGHKTGFFLDQRDNRIDIERYIREGDRVLDICCYTGGFSVHCGIKGAEILGVDISKKALGNIKRFVKTHGHRVISTEESEDGFKIVVK